LFLTGAPAVPNYLTDPIGAAKNSSRALYGAWPVHNKLVAVPA